MTFPDGTAPAPFVAADVAVPPLAVRAKYLTSNLCRMVHLVDYPARTTRHHALIKIAQCVHSMATALYGTGDTAFDDIPGSWLGQADNASPVLAHAIRLGNDHSPTLARARLAAPVPNDNDADDVPEARMMLHQHMLTLVRLAATSPHADVRARLRAILRGLRAMRVPVPQPAHPSPSYFLLPTELVPLPAPRRTAGGETDSDDEAAWAGDRPPRIPGYGTARDVRAAFKDVTAPAAHGSTMATRLAHLDRVLAYFPKYLVAFRRAYRRLLFDMSGPLPRAWRLYLALMAAAQFRSVPVAGLLRVEYLQAGGDPAWLANPTAVPRKLAAFASANALLAHQPWQVTHEHIATLVDPMHATGDGWTLAELVHAATIVAMVHGMAAAAFATGLVPEWDAFGGAVVVPDDGLSPSPTPSSLSRSDSAILNADAATAPADAVFDIPTFKFVFPREAQLTDVLISRLRESGCDEEDPGESGMEDGGDGDDADRLQAFAQVDSFTSLDDDDTEPPVPNPYAGRTFLATLPPPVPPSAEALFEATADEDVTLPYHVPGVIPALAAPDMARMAVDYTGASGDSVTHHADFDVRNGDAVFRLADWSWEEHGVDMVAKYLGSDESDLLEDVFHEARDMTDGSLFAAEEDEEEEEEEDDEDDEGTVPSGDDTASVAPSVAGSSVRGATDIDTFPFRQAVWNFVLRLFGQLHDDYDYSQINHFVNRRAKAFIKKIACTPHLLTYQDWTRMGVLLRPEEKAHLVVLVCEARKQAELVAALSAIDKYLES
ncbi:Sestrin-1 [Allomyces javanicus]|nr:Sestrin-1 [Allomyces javanicus]